MSPPISAPTDVQFQRYLHGELTGVELASVERYLEEHDDLGHVLAPTLSMDPLLEALKRTDTRIVEARTPELGELMARLERLPTEPLPTRESCIRILGDYELQSELGRGGMGVVFQAQQVSLNRPVALKMILAGQFASADAVERFRREAAAAAHLDHPHIVPVYEVGTCDGHHYFSMKLISGRSLSDTKSDWSVLRAEEPSASLSHSILRARQHRLARLIETLARAVDHAHQRGVLHRDLKPGNVLIDTEGEPHITDFGLAKRMDAEAQLTASHAIVGTPAYMSPEQAVGAKHVTTAADVYGLGAILYELLTGQRLFQGDSPTQILRMVLESEPTAPRAIEPRLNLDLETICLSCLQKEPQRRYGSAAALADDLRHFLNGEPILARPVGTFGRFGRWCQRNPVIASLTAGAFFSLTIGLSVATFFAFKAADQAVSERKQRGIAERREQEAVTAGTLEKVARALAQRKEKEALAAQAELTQQADALRRQVYRNTVSLAYREWQAQNGPQAASLLDTCDPKLRGWEWSYCSRLTRLQQLELHRSPKEEFSGVAFSPDGAHIAGAGDLGTVVVWDAVTGRELFSVQHPRPEKVTYSNRRIDTLKYSPDGAKLLVAGVDSVVRLLNARDGHEVATYPGFQWGVRSVAFSADGRRIAASSGFEGIAISYEVRVWDVESRQQLLNLNGHTHTVTGIAFSPDGRRLVSAGIDRRVKVWDLESGREAMNFSIDTSLVFGVTYSRDGERILAAGGDSLVHIWNARTGEPLPPLTGHRNGVRSVAVSPDGRRFATASLDGTAALWNAETGERLWTLQGHVAGLNSLAFSHDGRRVATAGADHRINVWDVTSDPQHRVLKGHINSIFSLTINHDGRFAATLGPQSTVYPNEFAVWDLNSGELIRLDQRFALSRDGHLPYRSLDFGPALQLVSGGSFRSEREVKVWDALSGRTLSALEFPEGATVNATSLSPDGQTIAVASDDAVVRLFEASSGQKKLAFRGHEKRVGVLRFSPDGQMLASGCGDKMLLWDLSGSIRHTFSARLLKSRGGLRPLCFSRDGQRFAAYGFPDANENPNHNVLTVVDLTSGERIAELRGHSRTINAADFSKDGTRIATGSDDNLIKIWDVAGASELLSLRGHTAPVMAVQFTPDGTKLVSAGADGAAIIWDASPTDKPTWLPEESLPPEAGPLIEQLLARNPKFSGRITQLRVDHGQIVELSFLGQSGLTDLTPLTELRQLRSLDLRGTRVANLTPLKSLPLIRLNLRDTLVRDLSPLQLMPLEHLDLRGASVSDLNALGGRPLVSLWCDAKIKLDDALLSRLPRLELLNGRPPSSAQAAQETARVLVGHRGEVRTVSLHPTGKAVASGGHDETVRIWNLAQPDAPTVVLPHSTIVTSVLYSPDGRWLSWSTGDSRPGSKSGAVWISPADRPNEKRVLAHDLPSVECLAFTSDGRVLVAGDFDGTVRLWDAESGGLKATWTGHPGSVLSIAFSPDNQILAAGTGRWSDLQQPGEIRLWNVETGQSLRTLNVRQAASCITFLPDAKQIAVSDWSRSAGVIDATTGALVAEWRGHDGRCRSHVLLDQGRRMATVGEDAQVLLLDLSTPLKTEILEGHTAPLRQISATADSKVIATSSSDGTVRVWSVPAASP